MFKKIAFSLVFVWLLQTVYSQHSITGIWDGIFVPTDDDLGQPYLVIEIHDLKDSLFTGVTHLYYPGNKYEHYKMAGRYSAKDGILVLKEAETIAVDLGFFGNCLGTYMLKLKTLPGEMQLAGNWTANISGCTTDTRVMLRKKIDIISKTPPAATEKKEKKTLPPPSSAPKKNQALVKAAPKTTPLPQTRAVQIPAIVKPPSITIPPILTLRETDVQSLIEIDNAEKDSIQIDVYDNGDIDGDTVSVYEEGVLRIAKKMITAKPITFYTSLNKTNTRIAHLRLVAESLGSIPPCTALMIVTTKLKRYEVRLSSNFSKNATVELFLKE